MAENIIGFSFIIKLVKDGKEFQCGKVWVEGTDRDADTVKVKLTKDGKARLCFAVHMKSSKKDFADVALQTKINELRKTISFKYGVDIDIVDIRSTIEYV